MAVNQMPDSFQILANFPNANITLWTAWEQRLKPVELQMHT